MTVTNSRLAVDSSLALSDARLVSRGQRAQIEDQDLGVSAPGRVTRVADRPGTNAADPGRYYVEVTPARAPTALVGNSVKLSIAVRSSRGKVLAVPLSALSLAADGSSRVQVDLGGGKTRRVVVIPALAAQGFVEVRPRKGGALKEGDLVVVGSGATVARRAPTGAVTPGVSGGA